MNDQGDCQETQARDSRGQVSGHSLRVGSAVSLDRGNALLVVGKIHGCHPIMQSQKSLKRVRRLGLSMANVGN